MIWLRGISIPLTGMICVERSCSVKANRNLWQSADDKRGCKGKQMMTIGVEELGKSGAELTSDLFCFLL